MALRCRERAPSTTSKPEPIFWGGMSASAKCGHDPRGSLFRRHHLGGGGLLVLVVPVAVAPTSSRRNAGGAKLMICQRSTLEVKPPALTKVGGAGASTIQRVTVT